MEDFEVVPVGTKAHINELEEKIKKIEERLKYIESDIGFLVKLLGMNENA